MISATELEHDYNALNELIVNCPELIQLEALLGGFNLFQVLKFEHGEIRHSNVLAWLLDPTESHGLAGSFLQGWLMRILYESEHSLSLEPIDVDTWALVNVEVRREWKHIDLLLILTMQSGEEWVVCIENKINSKQHSDQLQRYHAVVEAEFPHCRRKVYIFLTKDQEVPKDDRYIQASYEQVHQCLKSAVNARTFSIGDEPKVLIDNYLRLIEEKFMNESDIARLAQQIYKKHKRAFDIIYEQRPDNLKLASDSIREHIGRNADVLGIQMSHCTKSYVRFLPKNWDQAGNQHGNNWGDVNHSILMEINLSGKSAVYLTVVAGRCPDEWIEPLWTRAHQAPFKRVVKIGKVRPKTWVTLYSEKIKISFEEDVLDADVIAKKILDWVGRRLKDPSLKEVVQLIANELPRLDSCFKAQNAEGS
ncbi:MULTISPECIES: PD-(D/E)XK nuclease family protein [unclassified Lentimonas]|uniref:PDDEXK-like family protein n=1 Tax=unclassified Lentimonas TaxID=2630993 RepID=UPI00132C8B99|nr:MULTISPECIES: PD-(D/E)XK nuclease family protein [unclassified Lentimonas]CAA6678382.1 Unannotated [Lentimonas sp. CC4]CAA6685474.1 Unannotated [Lentimonas sp. CC6]CAA6690541.1 Unannotated [Lentimonas sp. CC10]CAA6695386.1 Unannotated [Lentimonas sp. CC19]CAA7068798.1 Unannotated [Lentimonas sp. CC11]